MKKLDIVNHIAVPFPQTEKDITRGETSSFLSTVEDCVAAIMIVTP